MPKLMAQNNVLNKKISIKVNKQTIPEILKEIEKKAGVTFNYNLRIIPGGKFNFKAEDEELSVVLVLLLQPHKLNFSVLFGNNIIITKQETKIKKYTISGFVYDEKTGEKLINANVYNLYSLKGTTTNQDGFYSLTLDEDSVNIAYSYVGYQIVANAFYLNANFIYNVNLKPNLILPSFTVTSKPNNGTQFKPDEYRLNTNTLKQFPVLFGETDIIKCLQLLPGVNAGNDGTTGINIRGGGPDQNLILLDDVPVYNPSHIYGFFSIFNSDVVKDVTLYKGGLSSRYGGRLSSVIDVRTIDGNTKKINYLVSVGILSSKLMINGPISRNKKTTMVVSGRRSYFDLLNSITKTTLFSNQYSPIYSGYYFYDFNGKINHRFNANHQISLSLYSGLDNSFIKNSFKIKDPQKVVKEKDNQTLFWGNKLGSIRYNHVITPKLFGWFLASYSRYNFGNESDYSYTEQNDSQNIENVYNYKFLSVIRDWNLMYNVEYKPLNWLNVKMGSGFVFHEFSREVSTFSNSIVKSIPSTKESVQSIEFNAYTDLYLRIHRKVNLTLGMLYAQYNLQGVQYLRPQPRINLNYKLNKHFLIHGAYSNSYQFLHLLTSSNAGLPIDLWLPSTNKIKPEYSNITSIGVGYTNKHIVLNVEGFNKNMGNLIDYKDLSNYIGKDNNWEDKVTVGKGWAYGIETLIEKKNGKTTGWISYTYSWNFRQFNEINNGKAFPYKYDRRHNLSIVAHHRITNTIDVAATWVYTSGANTTLPTQVYYAGSGLSPDNIIYVFGERNAFKFPDYHKLDFGVNFKRIRTKYERVWSIGAYNVYNRYNTFYVTPAYDNSGNRVLRMVSLFPILPNVNYKINF
ncbi:MAG: carboxypeptidase-like regulatory domain-containing protein [Bacteroidota bacterium]